MHVCSGKIGALPAPISPSILPPCEPAGRGDNALAFTNYRHHHENVSHGQDFKHSLVAVHQDLVQSPGKEF